jgi:hypothetical protein
MDIKIRLIHEAWWAVENESVKKLFLSVILEYSKINRDQLGKEIADKMNEKHTK